MLCIFSVLEEFARRLEAQYSRFETVSPSAGISRDSRQDKLQSSVGQLSYKLACA